MKKETEGLTMAAQNQLLRTRWVKHYTGRTTDSPKCRTCGKMDENVSHIVSECNELAQNFIISKFHGKNNIVLKLSIGWNSLLPEVWRSMRLFILSVIVIPQVKTSIQPIKNGYFNDISLDVAHLIH